MYMYMIYSNEYKRHSLVILTMTPSQAGAFLITCARLIIKLTTLSFSVHDNSIVSYRSEKWTFMEHSHVIVGCQLLFLNVLFYASSRRSLFSQPPRSRWSKRV